MKRTPNYAVSTNKISQTFDANTVPPCCGLASSLTAHRQSQNNTTALCKDPGYRLSPFYPGLTAHASVSFQRPVSPLDLGNGTSPCAALSTMTLSARSSSSCPSSRILTSFSTSESSPYLATESQSLARSASAGYAAPYRSRSRSFALTSSGHNQAFPNHLRLRQ